MAYSKQTWNTTSYVNPTRMNHIEEGIQANSDRVFAMPTMYGAWTTTVGKGTRTVTFKFPEGGYTYFKVEVYPRGDGANFVYMGYGRANDTEMTAPINGNGITVGYDNSTYTLTITITSNFAFPVLITSNQSFTITES